jgi:hypothetical protein
MASFASSYIPTVASQVTRAADSASMIGNNFARWFNAVAGSFSVDAVASGQQFSGFFNLTGGNEQQAYHNGSANVAVKYGSVNLTISFSGTKFATAYDGAGTAAASGSNVSTNATAFTGTATGMQIGLSTFPRYLNGTIARIAYYNRRLANTELQGISS